MERERELDPDICGCILEFLLFNSADDLLVKKLIKAFPPFNLNPCSEKAILLRSIQTQIQAGHITHKILDSLEMIHRIDSDQRLPIPDTMKEAYCAVALDCTAKFFTVDPNPNPDAVNRIWRGRVESLERSRASDLVSDLLRNRRRQVEAAFEDEEARRCLIAMNTRKEAIHRLRLYIGEAFASMGSPVLERACLRFTSSQDGQLQAH
ncbi:hypothetical protein V6N13_069840 [Hibiscus sabdariffa]|uniref:Uncharacterized protein n=1 Tax=Hibiscus sabdariffa TaxID=183260 RepID=A0ABR2BIS2_9ROSI